MPTAPLDVCRQPGCWARVPSGYCAAHEPLSSRNHGGRSRQARGYDRDYERERRALLGLPCALQLQGCTGIATTADHGPAGLRPACSHCNYADGARRARQVGPRVPR
jgi:hypothetical protein